MKDFIRIGNAQAFWGDRPSAAIDLLRQCPELDYLTMDYLAEVSMSILAIQQERNPELGYPRDFVQVVQKLSDYWSSGGRCRLIANAGGLNPVACAQACQRVLESAGCRSIKIAVVSGDNVLNILKTADATQECFRNLDDGRPLANVQDRLVTANAYLGCPGIVEALKTGADIVITGRVADPSMVLAACVYHFEWAADDWNRLAQGTVAGHLLECGTQVTGGISTDWLSIPAPAHIGFPIVEMQVDGSFIVTKPNGTGGVVNEQTVKEQLVYEIGDPDCYLSPDVQVSFLSLQISQAGKDRVSVTGARGSAAPITLKVSATFRDGFRAAGTLTVFGHRSADKARRSGQVVLQQLQEAGWSYRDTLIECLGTADSVPLTTGPHSESQSLETIMRVAVESESKTAVEAFSQAMMSLVTAGAQGTTGYAEGRPTVHSVFRYWPCLIEAARLSATVSTITSHDTSNVRTTPAHWPTARQLDRFDIEQHPLVDQELKTGRLIDLAYGRSGDKGTGANVGILVRDMRDYAWLADWLTVERVQQYFARLNIASVQRFEMPNLGGLNFVISGILRSGNRNDAQGKALAQALLTMPLERSPS